MICVPSSMCLELKEKIKIEKEDATKAGLKTELSVHVARSNAFFYIFTRY